MDETPDILTEQLIVDLIRSHRAMAVEHYRHMNYHLRRSLGIAPVEVADQPQKDGHWYSKEFKVGLMREMDETGLPVSEIVARHKILQSTISIWRKKWKRSGEFGFKEKQHTMAAKA